jgi:hypothetical protein
VSGRNVGAEGSALRINCRGVRPVRGEPFEEGVDFREWGLVPDGVDKENEGKTPPRGSGVRGVSGNSLTSEASSKVAELIHLSSLALG